jgi:hypothetical protein
VTAPAEDTPPDRALWSIVASNVLAAVLAIALDWDVVELLWPFWIQSVVIGYYARRRMLLLQDFSVEGLKFGNRPATESPEDQRSAANFFAFHYGFFHCGYFLYLMQRSAQQQFDFVDANLLVVVALAFVLAHRQSHREHVAADLAGRPNLGALMFMPYLRVVPMHLVILFGATQGGGVGTILLFTILKTLADIGMHKFEHRKLQRPAAGAEDYTRQP